MPVLHSPHFAVHQRKRILSGPWGLCTGGKLHENSYDVLIFPEWALLCLPAAWQSLDGEMGIFGPLCITTHGTNGTSRLYTKTSHTRFRDHDTWLWLPRNCCSKKQCLYLEGWLTKKAQHLKKGQTSGILIEEFEVKYHWQSGTLPALRHPHGARLLGTHISQHPLVGRFLESTCSRCSGPGKEEKQVASRVRKDKGGDHTVT